LPPVVLFYADNSGGRREIGRQKFDTMGTT
jgi:hypothetical protein